MALGYKKIDSKTDFDSLERKDIENNLIFTGFYICDSPLKFDTKKYIDMLREAEFGLLMITGDNMFTAISIGSRLKLSPREDYMILDKEGENIVFMDQNESTTVANMDDIEKMKNYG